MRIFNPRSSQNKHTEFSSTKELSLTVYNQLSFLTLANPRSIIIDLGTSYLSFFFQGPFVKGVILALITRYTWLPGNRVDGINREGGTTC